MVEKNCVCSGFCDQDFPIIEKKCKSTTEPMEIPYGMPEGLKVYIDPNKCTGCGMCAELCPFNLPQSDPIGKFMIERVDLCVGCSACQRNCPVHAIYLQEQKGCGCLWNVVSEKRSKGKKCCN